MNCPININGVLIDSTIAPLLARELNVIIKLFEASTGDDAEPIDKILVALHRLKGSSGFIGLESIEKRTREIEIKIQETKSYHVDGVKSFLEELNNLLAEINNALH